MVAVATHLSWLDFLLIFLLCIVACAIATRYPRGPRG
jgi:hypothetical protein